MSHSEVEELDEHSNGAEDLDEDDQGDPPLGEPFALAMGCDLLQKAGGVPGCYASIRCDCGRAFKVDLLSEGLKACPGCRVNYSHVLLVAPADDTEITRELMDALHGTPEGDELGQQNDNDEPIDATDEPHPFPGHDDDDSDV